MSNSAAYQEGQNAFITEFTEHTVIENNYPQGSYFYEEWQAGYRAMDAEIQHKMAPKVFHYEEIAQCA